MLAPVLILAALLGAAAAPDTTGPAPAPDSTGRARAPDSTGRAVAPDSSGSEAAMPADVLALVDAGRLVAAPAMLEPAGVGVDALGHVWASDAAADRLYRWDAAGRALDGIGSLGGGDNEFRRPTAVTRLGSLGIAVLDLENRRIVAYDLLGRRTDLVIALDDATLESRTGRITPVGLAADRGAGLVVADAERDRVLAFDFAGNFVRELGGFGSGPGSFHGLVAVALTPRGEILTAERPGSGPGARGRGGRQDSPARVQRLDPGGTPLAAWPLVPADALPLAIAADDSGRVAVSTRDARGGSITLYDRHGRRLGGTSAAGAASALAFGSDGSLWAAQSDPPGVHRFTLAPAESRK